MKRRLLAALLLCAFACVPLVLAQQRQVCENAPPNRLIVNERGRVSRDDPTPLNVREGPSTNFDPPIGLIPVGGIFYVLEGPECSPRYAWYRVEYIRSNGETLTGWVAEGDSDGYFVETYPPGE
jgi:hypothetical protein